MVLNRVFICKLAIFLLVVSSVCIIGTPVHADLYHETEPGETLNSVAAHYHVTPQAVRAANKLDATRDDTPLPAMLLLIPVGVAPTQEVINPEEKPPVVDSIITKLMRYVVQNGDTIQSIAKKFSKPDAPVSVEEIRRRNYIFGEPTAGTMLLVPVATKAYKGIDKENPSGINPDKTVGDVLKVIPGQERQNPTSPKTKAPILAQVAKISAPVAAVRRKPTPSAEILYLCDIGVDLAVTKQDGLWSQVLMSDGSAGWILTKSLKFTNITVDTTTQIISNSNKSLAPQSVIALTNHKKTPTVKINLPSDVSSKSIKTHYSTYPADVQTKRLPAGFVGHDPIAVYLGLEDKRSEKGKYETTSQYESRLLKLRSTPLFGRVYMNSSLAFTVTPNWCDYNADTKSFQAHFAGLAKTTGGDWEHRNAHLTFVTRSWTKDGGSYIGQNAFGATVKVDRWHDYAFGFQITNPNEFDFIPISQYGGKYRISLDAEVIPKIAPQVEKNIRALFLGYITSPLQSQDSDFKSATFDSPYSASKSVNYVCFRLKAVWFYDFVTGAIYQKLGPKT